MCFYYDGYCEVFSPRIVVGRKQYRCVSCRAEILPGQQHISIFSVYEGDASTDRICNLCSQDHALIHRYEVLHGCSGSEAWCPLDRIAEVIRGGDRAGDFWNEEFHGDRHGYFYKPVLFWPYGAAPSGIHRDLKAIPDLVEFCQ